MKFENLILFGSSVFESLHIFQEVKYITARKLVLFCYLFILHSTDGIRRVTKISTAADHEHNFRSMQKQNKKVTSTIFFSSHSDVFFLSFLLRKEKHEKKLNSVSEKQL